jgi:ribosomal protein S18 acetylase RimI-like enzyme
MPYSLRFANEKDIPFLIDTIIAAEKSGTEKCGLSNLLGLTEELTRQGLHKILSEEIAGCEFSTNEFAVAVFNEQPVAAFCGWVEGENDDEQPSAVLKSNLLIHGFGTSVIPALQQHKVLLSAIQLQRTKGTHQMEYAYVNPTHRGKQLIDRLIDFLISSAKDKNPSLKATQVQVYANNLKAIEVYSRMGYAPFQKAVYSPEMNGNVLPFHEKWTLQKPLTH